MSSYYDTFGNGPENYDDDPDGVEAERREVEEDQQRNPHAYGLPRQHVRYVCRCNQFGCQFCEGGLFACSVCDGYEGQLTTECSGKKQTQWTLDEVYAAKRDFINGEWITGENVGPMKRDAGEHCNARALDEAIAQVSKRMERDGVLIEASDLNHGD